jgi:hypothetical protein
MARIAVQQAEPDDDNADADDAAAAVQVNDNVPLAQHVLQQVAAHQQGTMLAHVSAYPWKDMRNKHEAAELADAIDALTEGDRDRALEILVRRLEGLKGVEFTGDWNVMEALKFRAPGGMFLPRDVLQKALQTAARFSKAKRAASSSSSGSGGRGRTRGRGRGRGGYNKANTSSSSSSSSKPAAGGGKA